MMIRRSVRVGVRAGLWCRRLERSVMPASPSARLRSAQRWAVVGETWKRSAARRRGQPSSTTQRARRRRPVSVRGALRWGTKAFLSYGVDVAVHTEPEGPHPHFKIGQP